jgi:hypothetical protein
MEIKKIKDRLKQCKYQHLKKIYAKNLSKLPENCKYNREIKLPNRSTLNICGFNFEDSYAVDLCYKQEHARDCNAFCARKTKEELYSDFIKDISDEQVRSTKYKDINTLYWVCPELAGEDFPESIGVANRITSFFKNFI